MRDKDKIRVVYIMDDTPPYDLYRNSKRPEVNMETGNGNWVGIWGYDWGNILGEYILKNDDEFIFEIRQPDLRADRIFEHKFENNTIHKLYPANQIKKNQIVSEMLIEDLYEPDNPRTIVHVGVPGKFAWSFINKIKAASKIGSFHGEISFPIDNLFILRKNVLNYGRVIGEHFGFKKIINNLDVITYQSETGLKLLRKNYQGKLEKVTMGTDFNLFKKTDKTACRKELKLPLDKKIIITVGRISNIKRQAEVIKELNKMKENHDFLYIIIGHGTKEEEDYINKLSQPLREKSQIKITGYERNEKLVKYYNSADAFLMTSSSEAGPVVSMEAIACELPIITTDTGNVSEFIRKENAGIIIGRKDLKGLGDAVKSLLSGAEIKICDRNRAKEIYDWNVIARKFIKIYRESLVPR